jgi:hypothetical protein
MLGLGAIKEKLLSFIPGFLGGAKPAPSRQSARSVSTSHSRNKLKEISQRVLEQADEPLPINKEQFKTILESMLDLKPKLNNMFQALAAKIPDKAYLIAQQMTDVSQISQNLANKMGLDLNVLSQIHGKFKNKAGLFQLKDNLGDLIKIVQFYAAQFGMSKEAAALA